MTAQIGSDAAATSNVFLSNQSVPEALSASAAAPVPPWNARGECADRRHELPGNARLELGRTKRGARQHARVPDRKAERRRQLGVALDAAALVPHERGYAHGLLRELERLTDARREHVEAA